MGVRSVEARPGKLNWALLRGFSNEVMTLSEEFFVVIRPGFIAGGGDIGGLSIDEILDGA